MEEIENQNILYTIKRSKRTKHLRISVSGEGKVTVIIPNSLVMNDEIRMAEMINALVRKKLGWIKKVLIKFSLLPTWQKRTYPRADYLANKEKVRELVFKRLDYFNQFYGLSWKRVAIRNQKSRWGSCSHQGNLNFNYKLIFLPSELQDYIIVHELCHLQELNHSKKFWDLVGKTLPDFKKLRQKLKGGIQ